MISIMIMIDVLQKFGVTENTGRHYTEGSVIFAQGSKALGIIVVIKGAVKLIRHTQSGHTIPIHSASSGESVAEASLFSETYHCDCVASENCSVKLVSKQEILNGLKDDPNLSLQFMRHLAEQTILYRRRIELLAMKGAKEKVFHALADGTKFGTIVQFANHLGLTHEATYRALSDLTKGGLVEKSGHGKYSITIL